jgi:hypothetical protein
MTVLHQEWQQWIQDNLTRQVPTDLLIETMINHQFDSNTARMMVENTVQTMIQGLGFDKDLINQINKHLYSPEQLATTYKAVEPCNGQNQP